MCGWCCFLTHGEVSIRERDHSVNCLLDKHKDLSSIHSTPVKARPGPATWLCGESQLCHHLPDYLLECDPWDLDG